MNNSILSFPVRRPVLTTVVYIIVVIIGLFSFWRLPIDLMPEITNPTITVSTSYGNAGPQEVEELITRPIESALAAVQGIDEITSSSSEGRSRVRTSFVWGTNLDEAVNDIRDRIDRVTGRLPDGASRPSIRKFDVTAFPIMFIGVSSDLDPSVTRELIEDQVQYRLERIDGVASVDIRGGARREIHATLRAAALEALKISPDMVVNTMRQENRNIPAGYVENGNKEIVVRALSEYGSVDELRNAVIAVRDGIPVTVGDVADISDGLQEITSIVRINNESGFTMSISKRSGVNTVAVAQGVHREVEILNKDFPQLRIVPLMDTSKFIQRSINSVGNALILGGIIAIIVLLFFLRNISSTFIIATVIPVSIIATFSFIYFGGLTLNMMSFGGLALGIGMLVDNAIVVLDNIFHHREKGTSPKESAVVGASEVSSAVISSTLTTLVVFIPVIFIRGISGIIFKQLAYVVSFSLACSLIAALTLIPMLTSRFLKISGNRNRKPTFFSILFERSERVYQYIELHYKNVVEWALSHRKTVLLSSLILLIGAISMIPLIGVELMPTADEGEVRVNVDMEVGTRRELIDRTVRQIEQIIEREVPEAEYILANANRVNSGYIRVSLVPKNKRQRSTSEIANVLRRSVRGIPGASIRIREGQGLFFLRRLTSGGGSNSVELELRGHDLEKGQRLAREISKTVEGVDGVTDVRVGREAGIPEYILRIDKKKAADLGLSASQIGTTVKTAMGGAQATTLRRDGKEFAVQVRLAEADRRTLDKLGRLTIINRSGVAIPLQAVAKISEATGPEEIDRRDRQRIISIDVNYSGKDLGSIVASIRNEIGKITIPSDFAVIIRGDYEEQQKSFRELMVGLFLAVILIYLVMAGQFESFKGPFVILFAIPMALIGIVLVLYLTATPFSMQAYIGCIILAGIVVNNAIVLIDYMNRLRRDQGIELYEAIKTACARRLRPIMMTALTTSLGLLPLALGLGEGGETQAPMARVVIGGLLSSSFITLILIPVIYSIVEDRFTRRRVGKGVASGFKPLSSVTALLILTIAGISLINNIQAAETDTLKVSLGDVLKRSAQHNPMIRIDRIDVDIAKSVVKEQQFRFEPAFSASFKQDRTINDGKSSDPEYEGAVQIAGNTPTGTEVSLRGAISPSSRSTASGTEFNRKLEMTFTQALLSKMGPIVNLAPVRKASYDLKISNEELTAYAQKLFADVERAYWDVYLAAEEIKIHEKSLELANRFLFESQERLNVGRIAPLQLVVVRAEQASRKKNLINAQTVYIQKKYRLLYLVNDSAFAWNSPIVTTDRPYRPQALDSVTLHLKAAKEYRPDLKQANLLLSKGELDVIQTRNGLLPKLDIFFTLAGEASAGSFGDAFTGDYKGTSLSTGLVLSLPVTNGISRQRYSRSVFSQKKIRISMENLRNLIELDVRSAWTEVNRAVSHIEAAGISRKLQEEKLNAEQARFAAGKSTEYLVLQVQRDLISSQLDETRAQVAYCNAITNLYLKDGTLLERRGVSSR